MGLFNSRYRYRLFAIVIFAYTLIQTRSSYMAPIVTMIFMLVVSRFFYKTSYNNTFINLLMPFGLFLLIGLVNHNPTNSIILDIVAMFPFVLVIADNQYFRHDFLKNKLSGLTRLTPISALLYCFIFSYMDYSVWGTTDIRFDYDRSTHLLLGAPLAPMFFVPLLLCYSNKKYNNRELISLIISVFLFFHFAIITSTKSVIVPILAVIIVRILLGMGSKQVSIKNAVIWISAFLLARYLINNYFMGFMDNLWLKFDEDNESNTNRIEEAQLYLSQCDYIQWIFGKGWGGLKTFHGEWDYIGGESMMHLGVVYLIMKGGLLLFALIYYPLIYIMIKDTKDKKYAYVLIAVFIIAKDLGHEIWQEFTFTQIYWLLVYYRFYKRKTHNAYLANEAKEIA